MRATVCELPLEPPQLASAWSALCQHTDDVRSDVVILPEFAFTPPVWEVDQFDQVAWNAAEAANKRWILRLPELRAAFAIGAGPVTRDGRPYNEGFLWSQENGYLPLRRKYFLPNEPLGWEARWFARGDPVFSRFTAGDLCFGLNICTELWALETYECYASLNVHAVVSPRATPASTTNKWLAVGTVAAVRTGGFSLSSNLVHPDGSYGGAGWIISPDGEVLARTSEEEPFCTLDIDLTASLRAQNTYPRYVFRSLSKHGSCVDGA